MDTSENIRVFLSDKIEDNRITCEVSRVINGERVRAVRKQLGLSQTEFAARMGMTQGYVTNIERNIREVNSRLAKLICDTYSVSETWLVSGEGDMFQDNEHLMLANLMKKHKLNSAEAALMEAFFKLTAIQREAAMIYLYRLLKQRRRM
ncbi:helix-turn-helix domain-containing protein [Selenomonas sp. KH1T6]|uniref:helix-turn-helix domain-containing protein n=1 Tax=Selenomonas sp. KH1T6 TaxID=3158784 RepID=UPI0008A78BEF|nr:Helix-turn-helix [Selenomonas ruminantium]